MSSREDWQRRLGPLYGGAVALVHTTPWRWPTAVHDEPRSSLWIVAVGLPIGIAAWVTAAGMRAVGVATPVAAIIGLAMLSLASAALIERGLGERIDQLQREVRSPTIATFMTLVFSTLIRAGAILVISPADWLEVLVAAAVVGRWAAVFLQALGEPIDYEDSRRSLVATPTPSWLTAVVSLAVAVLVVFALGEAGIVAFALTAVAAFALGLDAQRRDHGLSAPVVAVAAAIGELVVLVVATI